MTKRTAEQLAELDVASILHPYTNGVAHAQSGPLIIERGEGIRVIDNQGKSYIEAMAGLWCVSLGYSEERLVEAATNQMRKLSYSHIFASKSTEPAIELAAQLIDMAPKDSQGQKMSKVYFGASGSDANDTAIKIVRYYNNARGLTKKKTIISRHQGYHGVTVASASLTGLPILHQDFDLPIQGIRHVGCPHFYRHAQPGESEDDFAQRLANELEDTILSEGPDTIAAFIAEPVMGAGGVIIPPANYFKLIQEVLHKYDILMIADEVICGFGRLGYAFGSEYFNIQPDMVICAKALTSAYQPLSATMISKEIAEVVTAHSGKLGTFGHGYTYTGHPVCCAVGVETLNIYKERDLFSHAHKVGEMLQAGLAEFKDRPYVGEVRGLGLIAAIELVENKASKASFDKKKGVGALCAKLAHENGLVVRPLPGQDAVALCPPLIITEDEIVEVLTLLRKTMDDLESRL